MKSKNTAKQPTQAFTPEQDKILQSIRDDQKEVEETKKILTDKIKKLLDEGEKLEDLEEAVKDLEQQAPIFKTNTHALRKAEQVFQSREYSLVLAFFGLALGAAYGLISGFSWPAILLYGAAAGIVGYGATRVFTGINQKIDEMVHRLSNWWNPQQQKSREKSLQSRIEAIVNTYNHYVPGYTKIRDLIKDKKPSNQQSSSFKSKFSPKR